MEDGGFKGMPFSLFPSTLHPVLKEIDDSVGSAGNGVLELDELTDIFSKFAEQKRAAADGSIAISGLPLQIQPTLKCFDVDGDGTVAPMELARGAELYLESKKQLKRLTIVSGILFLLMGVMLGAITGLVFAVVELSKETETSSTGVTTVKGKDTAMATGSVTQNGNLLQSTGMSQEQLSDVSKITLTKPDGTVITYGVKGASKGTTAAASSRRRQRRMRRRALLGMSEEAAEEAEAAHQRRHLLMTGFNETKGDNETVIVVFDVGDGDKANIFCDPTCHVHVYHKDIFDYAMPLGEDSTYRRSLLSFNRRQTRSLLSHAEPIRAAARKLLEEEYTDYTIEGPVLELGIKGIMEDPVQVDDRCKTCLDENCTYSITNVCTATGIFAVPNTTCSESNLRENCKDCITICDDDEDDDSESSDEDDK